MEENTPEKKSEEKTESEIKNAPTETLAEAPTIDFSKMDQKVLKMAEKFGIPIGDILNWMQWQENRIKHMEEYLQKTLPDDMKNAFRNGMQEAFQQQPVAQKALQQGGQPGGLGALLQLAPLLSGGVGQDDTMQKLTVQFMQESIKGLQSDRDFTLAIKNAIVGKIAGKAVSDVANL